MRLFAGSRTVVFRLVALNVAIFLIQALLPWRVDRWIDETFGLSREGLFSGEVWQLVTHQFLHAGILHLLVNMLGLWFAGKALESLIGGRRFLTLYLLCGICGGLLQVALTSGSVLIGASGAVIGVVCAFSAVYPELKIRALVFFVIPVNMQAKWLGRIIVGVSVGMILLGWDTQIGHEAHLGGALAGYAWVWMAKRRLIAWR